MADRAGTVIQCGGDLGRYGLDQLHPGDVATEVAYFLEGLLPVDSAMVLSRVQTSTGTFADIHLIPAGESNCVLLMDTSAEVAERTQIEQAFRETAELLRHAEKMEALGRLAGGVAHDFNNLLTVILGYSQVLADTAPTAHFRSAAMEILMAAKKATAVTQQLLSFSRRQKLKPETLDLNSLIAGVEQLLQRLIGEDIAITTVLENNLGCVEGDRGQIEQILMNLAANARDAMRGGGRLEIGTSNITVDEAFIRRHSSLKLHYGRYVRMAVIDTGCGMDADTRARIFEPFYTSKPAGQGTGLGLSIVYGIVTQAGGDVLVTSEIGKGTCIEVLLPVVDKTAVAGPPVSVQAAPTGTETILLVEDEEGVRNLLETVLADLGYNVLASPDPFSAIQLSRDYSGAIDLLVTDMILPQMDGGRLAETILGERPRIRVLYVSGYAEQSVTDRLNAPLGTFLGKPFTRATLAGKVREALSGRGASPSTAAG
jgi:signal transduction histidine kinase